MSIFKIPYKLEVWEEFYNSEIRDWEEKRSVCLGAHDMDYSGAAYDIKFDENINGEKNLSFSLVGDYIDVTTGQKTHNYLVDFLYNEVKVKLQYDGEWYDFIVKNIAENHTTQLSYQYTCKYLPMIELAKIGYDIQFSLDDTTGSAIQTAPEFIEKTLENTDWRYLKAGSAPCVKDLSIDFTEYRREIAYQTRLTKNIKLYHFKIEDGKLKKTDYFFSHGTIIIPYSQLEVEGDIFVSLLDENLQIYDNLIDRHQLYVTENPFPTGLIPSDYQIEVPRKSPMSDFISYIDSIETHNTINQYCTRGYLEDGTLTYRRQITKVTDRGYFKTQDRVPVVRYKVESSFPVGKTVFEFEYKNLYYNFDLTKGKKDGEPCGVGPIEFGETFDFYLDGTAGKIIRNSDWDIDYGNSVGYIDPDPELHAMVGVPKDYYVLQKNTNGTIDYIKYTDLNSFDIGLETPQEGFYELDTKVYGSMSINDAYVYSTYQYFTVERDAIGVVNKINVLGYSDVEDGYYEIFEGEKDPNIAYYTFNSVTAKYEVDNINGNYIKIVYLVEESFDMYRTVEVSRSNCFNITQQVAETFDVWCRYIVEYDNDGRVAIGEDGRKKKWVTLTNTYGTLNKIGFTYGLNTNSIQRTINSDEIITKLYVDYSEGSAAEDGYVAIQYSDHNVSGENTIYNFDYYVQKGLLKYGNLKFDLYKLEDKIYDPKTEEGKKGYLPLKEFRSEWELEDGVVEKEEELDLEYLGYMEGNPEGPGFLRQLGLLNKYYDTIQGTLIKEDGLYTSRYQWKTQKEAYEVAINTGDGSLSGSREQDEKNLKDITDELISIESKIRYRESLLAKIVRRKQEITRIFNRAYARFIQEGNWAGNSYITHDDYYADALKVSQDGAKPHAEYTLSVINLYALPNYKEFKYNIGDITWIEDTEYFGYNNNGTPYHEKVIVTQINRTLDVPINDTFTIANYSNKFEDVFQTIAAQVQSYTLNEQLYQRASHISSNGTLSPNVMTNTFTGNKDITLVSNDYVTQTGEGLTFKNPADRNKLLKITAGGIVISNDGGNSYSTGIYNGKINTSLLQSGQLNVEHVHIYSTGSPGAIVMTGDQFRMYSVDKDAYKKLYGEDYNIDSLFKETVDIVRPDDGKLYYIKDDDGVYKSVNSSLGLDLTQKYYEYVGGSSHAAREIIISPTVGLKIRSGNEDKVYFDTDGNLTLAGRIIAQSGSIGGFKIEQNYISTKDKTTGMSGGINSEYNPTSQEKNSDNSKVSGYCFWAGATNEDPATAPFYVMTDGSVRASKISLDLGQDEGVTSTIGGWTIANNRLHTDDNKLTHTIAARGIVKGKVDPSQKASTKTDWRLLFGAYSDVDSEDDPVGNFGVDSGGILYANNPILYNATLYNATITGTISGYCTTAEFNELVKRVKALEDAAT